MSDIEQDLDHEPESSDLRPSWSKKIFGGWKRALMSLAFFYALLIVLLVLMEPSLLYPAPKYPVGNWEPPFTHEDVEFSASDGTKLHSWIVRSTSLREDPRYVLYCHGNGENVALAGGWSVLDIVDKLDATVMVFDYRGYGKSEGSPHEAGIKLDSDRALEVFCERMEIKASDVILIGHSLGGGIAAHLAATQGCKALVLQKTFSSLPDVAASKYPFVPVHLLMRNRFDSVAAIKEYDGPLFQAHGDSDRVIPFRFGEKLFASATQNPLNQFVPLPGFGHNDGFPKGYWEQVDQWLEKVAGEPQPNL